MHDIVYYGAMLWMVGLLCVSLGLATRASKSIDRILALDVVTLMLVALLILYSATTETSYYLDAALLISLITFISVVVVARYQSERRVFGAAEGEEP